MRLFTIVIFFILAHSLNAQEDINYIHRPNINKVIAQQGLNLRSKPTAKSEKLGNVPYGETVEILHRESYGLEELQSIKTQTTTYTIKGHWLKVKYNGVIGYVNNAYLYNSRIYDPQEDNHKYNNDYLILLPGIQCQNNFHKLSKFNLYGYYQTEENCWLEPIKVEFGRNVTSMADVSVIAKADKDLIFIIGSKKELSPGSINMLDENISLFEDLNINDTKKEQIIHQSPDCEVTRVKTEHWHDHTLKLKHKNEYQYMLDSRHEGDLHTIKWTGDIDGDGRTDYILEYGEKNMMTVLYLSSERSGGGLVKGVARFLSGYCC